jgi:hypothetical protein
MFLLEAKGDKGALHLVTIITLCGCLGKGLNMQNLAFGVNGLGTPRYKYQ